jgi:hypothetical protein
LRLGWHPILILQSCRATEEPDKPEALSDQTHR